MTITLEQKHYLPITIEDAEKDIIELWQKDEVIHLERERIYELISILQKFQNT